LLTSLRNDVAELMDYGHERHEDLNEAARLILTIMRECERGGLVTLSMPTFQRIAHLAAIGTAMLRIEDLEKEIGEGL